MSAAKHAGSGRARRRPASRFRRTIRLALCAVLVVGVSTAVETSAHGDTPYTFTEQKFTGAFPPTDWQIASGAWAQQCTPVPPGGGCSAVDTITTTGGESDRMYYAPTTQIPSNLQNAQLTFTSDVNPDATSSGVSGSVLQASVNGSTGDFAILFMTQTSGDTPGVATTHTVPLANLNLPIAFNFQSFGDTGTNPVETWGISDVKITGTLPSTAYTLTADPIPNTAYPHVIAGTPVTITLSGESNPTGDSLNFQVVTPPKYGTLGTITQVDATHATVVYTTAANACPDPNGTPGYLCIDQFTYEATDLTGNVSAPATATLDLNPGGAGSEQVGITAPTNTSYVTVSEGGNLVQAANLSGEVSLTPPDFPDEVEVQLLASTGTIDLLNAGAAGITFDNGTTNNSAQMYFQGSITNVNNALGTFIFNPPSGTTPPATINVNAADLGPTGQSGFIVSAQKTITVNGVVNATPPSVSLPTGPLSVTTTGSPLTFPAGAATGISLADASATATTNDSVILQVSGGNLSIPAADTTGPSPLVTATTGVGELTLTGTVAHLNQALVDVTYAPGTTSETQVTLTASATDPDDGLGSTPVSTTITVIHGPTIFGTNSVGTLANDPVVVFLCASGPANDQLSYTINSGPSNGTLTADPSAQASTSGCSQNPGTLISGYLYTPNANFVGNDSFHYTVTDATTSLSASADVTISVSAHAKPTAYPVSASTTEDHAVDVTLCGSNPDPTPAALTFVVDAPPTFGTLTAKGVPALDPCPNAEQAFTYTYTPKPGTFSTDGVDSFSYYVTNGTHSDDASATITVTTLTPQVVAQAITVNENSSVSIQFCATAPDGPLTFTTTSPSHGILDSMVAATSGPPCPTGYTSFQTMRYLPNSNYFGSDAFFFDASGGGYTSAEVEVDITVNEVEIAPTADAKSVLDIAPNPVNVTLTGASANNVPLTYRVVNGPTHGTLTGTLPNLVYTPSIANGTDTFTYVSNDGTDDSAPATVTITITSPSLSSSVCYAGAPIDINHDACAGSLTPVSDGHGGTVWLAHDSGNRDAELQLQVAITNSSTAPDTVTITAPGSSGGWQVLYDVDGGDQTAQVTGSGYQVTLGAAGTSTATAYVIVNVFSPHLLPAPVTFPFSVSAASGNGNVSTSVPIEVQDGTSAPALTLAQGDGSGGVQFPTALALAPVMYVGGPADTAQVVAGLTGTGDNTVTLTATVPAGSIDVGLRFIEGASTDITSQVLAGTFTMTCYASGGCPPIHAVLTPGTQGGTYSVELAETSSVDGQSSLGFIDATVASSVGPDFYTTPPRLGYNVFEPTPVTQHITTPVLANHSATQRIILRTTSSVTDTFTLGATSVGAGAVTVTATAPDDGSGPITTPVDITAVILAGTYQVTMTPGQEQYIYVTVAAGSASNVDAADVTLTASSAIDTAKVDSFLVQFPAYSFVPDEVLTGPDGTLIGANVYDSGNGSTESGFYPVGLTPRTIDVGLFERGTGPQQGSDSVLVKAPGSTANFAVSYQLIQNGATTDVTSQVTGAGLTVQLLPSGQMLQMTAAETQGAQTGVPGYFTIGATSQLSGLGDHVQVQLYTNGASQLRFGGLPQPEPSDITQTVAQDGVSRTAPIAPAGYTPGVYYGAYPDPSGGKFVYDSTYDTFQVQIASENAVHAVHRLVLDAPNLNQSTTPAWERDVFATPYFNQGTPVLPANPLGSGGVNPTITVNGVDVTSQVLAGTYTTPSMGTNDTLTLTVSFAPPAGDSRRYAPLRFTLEDATSGTVEDSLTLGLSSIIECDQSLSGQQSIASNGNHLNFESYDRTNNGNSCVQHLTSAYLSNTPVDFSAASGGGADNPNGLWLLPQQGALIRIDTTTLAVTSAYVKVYVDTSLLDANGNPDPTTLSLYSYIGSYQSFTWDTTDQRNGIEIPADPGIGKSPFPMIVPSQTYWPNNTMAAARYFQVDTTTGTPELIGTMGVNEPWYQGDVNLAMPISYETGLTLNYAAPTDTTASLPDDNGTTTYGMFWTTRQDGTVIQGGCLGLPVQFLSMFGVPAGHCIIEVVTTFLPISSDPGAEAKIAQITFQLKPAGPQIGTPTFNLKNANGEIDIDPSTGALKEVTANATFGVGPVTPCYETKLAHKESGAVLTAQQKAEDAACPQNYFIFYAQITFKQGGFTNTVDGGYGIQFFGTLSFLGDIQLTSMELDIQTSPFNVHITASPIDLSISAGISASASLTLSGDIGALGFDISMTGSLTVMGYNVASATGVLSTKGIGICGSLAGDSVGIGMDWDGTPSFFPTGCDASQYTVTS